MAASLVRRAASIVFCVLLCPTLKPSHAPPRAMKPETRGAMNGARRAHQEESPPGSSLIGATCSTRTTKGACDGGTAGFEEPAAGGPEGGDPGGSDCGVWASTPSTPAINAKTMMPFRRCSTVLLIDCTFYALCS